MWVIYHGHYASSLPLLAAILHQHCYSTAVSSVGSETLPFLDCNCFEEHIFRALSHRNSAVLTYLGTDGGGNKILILGRNRFFTILERAIRAALVLSDTHDGVLFVNTSTCENYRIWLGLQLRQHLNRQLDLMGPSSFLTMILAPVRELSDLLVEQGTRQAFPKILAQVRSLEVHLC